jgi:exodeoxyribonuclease-3
MKIITWNVNGLRAAMKKGAMAWIWAQDPDVICLQEIKSRPDQLALDYLEQLTGYQAFWNPAERPGYSGVVTLTRENPLQTSYGLGDVLFDREGRVVCTRQNGFLLFNIYFPNGQRDFGRLTFKLDFYARLLEMCNQLQAAGEQIVLCGDFNTAHKEIDLKNARQNVNNSGFLPEERAWIDRYLEGGFVDVYRMLYPQRIQYTWWTFIGNARARNTGWRLDYFLVSQALLARIQDVIIHDEVLGSDHCPVTLLID